MKLLLKKCSVWRIFLSLIRFNKEPAQVGSLLDLLDEPQNGRSTSQKRFIVQSTKTPLALQRLKIGGYKFYYF